MYTKKQIFLSVFVFFLVNGCSFLFLASPIITGIIMWKQGEAKKYYEEDYKIVYRSIKRTLQKYNLTVIRQQNYNHESVIVAGNGNRFKIKVYKESDRHVCVSIRINVFGDKELAELIYKSIDDYIYVVEYDSNGNPLD